VLRPNTWDLHESRRLVTFVTDGFENYRNAFNKLFYRACRLAFGVPIACRKYGLKHNNNPIERYNGDIKGRIKTMRHFGSHEGAESFLNMKRTIHNFVNPHMGLRGSTPAEEAGIHLNLGRRRLYNMIRIRSKKTHHSLRRQYPQRMVFFRSYDTIGGISESFFGKYWICPRRDLNARPLPHFRTLHRLAAQFTSRREVLCPS